MFTWAAAKKILTGTIGPLIMEKLKLIAKYPWHSAVVLLVVVIGVGAVYHLRMVSSLEDTISSLEEELTQERRRIQSMIDDVDDIPDSSPVVPDFGDVDFDFDENRPDLTPSVVMFEDVVGEFSLELEEMTDDEILEKGRPDTFDFRDRASGEFARRLKESLTERSAIDRDTE